MRSTLALIILLLSKMTSGLLSPTSFQLSRSRGQCVTRAVVGPEEASSRRPTAAAVTRRRLFEGSCAVTAAAVLSTPVTSAVAKETVDVKSTIPLESLRLGLASVPQRDIVITGANSGVGLAGAKLLTAAGHRYLFTSFNIFLLQNASINNHLSVPPLMALDPNLSFTSSCLTPCAEWSLRVEHKPRQMLPPKHAMILLKKLP